MQFLSCHQRKFSIERYKPFIFSGIQGFPNKIPNNIRKHLPKFIVQIFESASKIFSTFMDLMGDYEIDHEDVVMKIFAQSLKEDARDLFSYLPVYMFCSFMG